jgi:transposase
MWPSRLCGVHARRARVEGGRDEIDSGCDLHASQQSIALLDRDTGVVVEKTLTHEGGAVREFYASIPPPVVVGIEATGSMGWFLRLMEELAIECRVGHPTAIRKAETRRQKHDSA